MKKSLSLLLTAACVFSLAACTQAPSPVDPLPEENPESGEIVVQNILIPGGDREIPGILTLPAGASAEKTVPAVIMLHGTASDKDEAGGGYKDLAGPMAENGIATLRIDFPGSGESKAEYIEYCYTTATADANAALAYLTALESVDSERVGIMGWSQGGTNALLAAASNENYKSVVTWAGADDLTILLTDEMRAQAAEFGYAVMEFEWREPLNLGQKWIEEVDATDIIAEVAKIKAPILAIAGTQDTVVLPEVADRIAAASVNPDTKTYLVQGADHTFNLFTESRDAYEDLCKATIEWFSETL